MGGLVARAVIENPDLCPKTVTRLIMVATPNHGTRLASLSCSMDVVEYLASEARRSESGPFMARYWMAYPRRPRIWSPIRHSWQNSIASREILTCSTQMSWERAVPCKAKISRIGREWLESPVDVARGCDAWTRSVLTPFVQADELFDGTGDGVVSVASGQLRGVEDVIVARFDHNEMFQIDASPVVQEIRNEILARICLR